MTIWKRKKYSVYYHDLAEHDCGYLAGLVLQTKLAIKGSSTKNRRLKRQKANTIRVDVRSSSERDENSSAAWR
jgi:hypothetical protein